MNSFNALWLINPAKLILPLPPTGGEGWGEGGQDRRMQFSNRTLLEFRGI